MASGSVVDFHAYGLDIGDTSSVKEEAIRALGKRVIAVFKEYNVCYLTNHGVKASLLEEFMLVSRNYFELPTEIKSEIPMDTCFKFGYTPNETLPYGKNWGVLYYNSILIL